MNLSTLCDKIDLQPDIKKQVLSFADNFDFQEIDEKQKGYFIYQNMKDALAQTQAILGEDMDGIKILSCMLKASLNAYEVYQEKGISDEIYFATMKCFTRFIEETYKMTGKLSTDYATLPENTSLQIKMKQHLLAGGVIRDAYGRIKV